jgi:hypothetical protein
MQKILAKLFFGTLITSITAIGALAADNSLGTWKLNMEKSKFSPSAPVKSLTQTREASDGGVKVTTTGEQADGTPINASYTAKYDGTETSVTGNAPYDTIALKQVNANTFTATQKKSDGKYTATVRLVVSKDGKTMTNTAKGTNAEGKAMNNTFVYEKQ